MTPTHQPLLQAPGLGTTQRGCPRWQPAPVRPARFGRAHCDGGNFACAVGKTGRKSRRKVRPTRILSTMGSREIMYHRQEGTQRASGSSEPARSSVGERSEGWYRPSRGLRHRRSCAYPDSCPLPTRSLPLERGAIWKRKIVYVVSSINRTLI